MLLSQIKHLILDMDGVLWRGETPMPGLADFFEALRQQTIDFVLATNNATKTAVQYTEKLTRFGIDVPPDRIVTSAEATASYLRREYPEVDLVYAVGEAGLQDALAAQEFDLLDSESVEKGEMAPLVVVGFSRHATYHQLAMGALLVHKGATFVGTNPDPSFPHELGPLPGAGSLLAVIETATKVSPTIIGKPGPIIFEEGMKKLGGSPDDTAMVGDRLSTDIAGANSAGLITILLLTGISTREDLDESEVQPDFVYDDITALRQALAEREQAQ
jgi:4-nitrophenyl phosphatase